MGKRSTVLVVAGLLVVCLVGTAAAAPTITKAVIKPHKSGQVRANLKGTLDPGDLAPGGAETIRIQLGTASQNIPLAAFKFNAKKNKYIYKGNGKQVVQKALIDLKKGLFKVKCRSFTTTDYRTPLHMGLRADRTYAFGVPVDEAAKKTKVLDPVVAISAGDPLGQGSIPPAGGTLDLAGVDLMLPANAVRGAGDVMIGATTAVLPGGLPPGVVAAGDALDIDIGAAGDRLEQPLQLTFEFDAGGVAPEDPVTVLHYDDFTGAYQPTTVLDVDRAGGTITIESRSFSVFLPVCLLDEDVPDSFAIPGFAADTTGWSIPNFGSYFAPGGNCLGMSSYCVWFFNEQPASLLSSTYPGADAEILATRAHLAQSQYWASKQFQLQTDLGESGTGQLLKAYLAVFGEPITLLMFGQEGGHACVCYGYDAAGFRFYDVNFPGMEQTVPFDSAAGFGGYSIYDQFGFVGQPSVGRNTDFQTLFDEAAGGFQSDQIILGSPLDVADPQIDARQVTLFGGVVDESWDGVSVFVNGQRFDAPLMPAGGPGELPTFLLDLPLSPGENPITILAGTGLGSQSAYAPGSAARSVTVQSTIAAADMLVAFTWDAAVDGDVYVIEPDGEASWWFEPLTGDGGNLNFDNTRGFGPEYYSSGAVEAGTYRVRVQYYDDYDTGLPLTGTISIVFDEDAPIPQVSELSFTIPTSDPTNAGPTRDGPSWRDIADVDIVNRTITPLQ